MSKIRIAMIDIRTILKMYFIERSSIRGIAAMTGIPYTTVHENITLAKSKGLNWAQIEPMTEEALEAALSTKETQRPLPNFALISDELQRRGVTLQLLWQEYREAQSDAYGYSRFCEMFETWKKKNEVYSPIPHKPGEELFVDYSGDGLEYVCSRTNSVRKAEIFVATLGASCRIYCEASESQQLSCWIESNINAFEYHGGVPQLVIPDNLKSGVTKADRYEATINRAYKHLGDYYGTFIAPARARKPKDKPLAEQSVQVVQRQILAPLRNATFFGLETVNQAIRELLEEVNRKPFQKRSGSRQSVYESIEKSALRPLPAERYRTRDWFTLPVGQDHHVVVDRHSYSVPYEHAYNKVDISLEINLVEIFHQGVLIARHHRSYIPGDKTTLHEHMPPKYQAYFDGLDKEKLLAKVAEMGPDLRAWVDGVFAQKGRPPKLLCNTVQGALSLIKPYGQARVDAVCRRAVVLGIYSYKELNRMLQRGADRLPLPIAGSLSSHLPQDHENIRGAEYFIKNI